MTDRYGDRAPQREAYDPAWEAPEQRRAETRKLRVRAEVAARFTRAQRAQTRFRPMGTHHA